MLDQIDVWMYGFSLALAALMLLPGAASAKGRVGRLGRAGGGRMGKLGAAKPGRLGGKPGSLAPKAPAAPRVQARAGGAAPRGSRMGRAGGAEAAPALELPRYSIFHPIALPGFLGGFGAFGFIGRGVGLDGLGAPLLGIAGGLLLSLAIFKLFVRLILGSEGGDAPAVESAVGALATVTTAIPAGGLGAVAYEAAGRRQTVPARAADGPLARGSEVVILEVRQHVALVGEFEDHPSQL